MHSLFPNLKAFVCCRDRATGGRDVMRRVNRSFALVVALATGLGTGAGAQDLPEASAERMQGRISTLSEFGANSDRGVDRVAYSTADIGGRDYIMGLMRTLGLEVRIDTGGNIIGSRPGKDPSLKPIMFGSHTDSVPGGGNYDGDVGVISALEAIEIMNEAGITTEHPLEVIVFSNEEGGLVGSLALTGKIRPAALDVVSHSGLTIRDGIDAIGGDHTRLDEAVYRRGDLTAFIELHIEQGAILDDEDFDIGVVEGIVGIRWWDVIILGVANHAGTTPMHKRQDAMLAAAHLTIAINEAALGIFGRHVATVGRIHAEPGAPNVIPGRVVMSLEIRDLTIPGMDQVFAAIKRRVRDIEDVTKTHIRFELIEVDSVPAPTDPRLRTIISAAAAELNLTYKLMPSGAGHDAQDMATIAPTGMIFVPSIGGISHSPREFTRPSDMANGADVLIRTILAIDRGALN